MLFALSGLAGLQAAEPDGYYNSAYGKSGYELKTALHKIIKEHGELSYSPGVWQAFQTTDVKSNGMIWDMYSNCEFIYKSGQCNATNYETDRECDCYNREHAFPKSWFGGSAPMYTDIHHIFPTDCYVNSKRYYYAYGEVGSPANFTSSNGSKLGNNTVSSTSLVFEPADEYKGDFARVWLYMATCYQDKISSWSGCKTARVCDGSTGKSFTDWVIAMLLKWHAQDPVSEKEILRNDAVYKLQGNRNPFIDHPELVNKIWGNDKTAFGQTESEKESNYYMDYTCKGDDGTVAGEGRIYLNLPNETKKSRPKSNVVKFSILFNEDFETLQGEDSPASSVAPLTDASLCRNVALFDGSVYPVKSGVRLGSSGSGGAVTLISTDKFADGFPVSFGAIIWGKGWSSTENTVTVRCEECTVKEQTVTFNKTKDELASGEYTLGSVNLVLASGQTKATISVKTQARKRVFIGDIRITAEHHEDLIISEYVEGTGNNKAIELYNGTLHRLNLSDYSLKRQTDGGAYGNELKLGGTLAPGKTYVIVHSSANASLKDLADLTHGSFPLFNGNDAVGLFKNGTLIDEVGCSGSPANWGKDVTLRRRCAFGPTLPYDSVFEWDRYPVNTIDDIGKHCEGVYAGGGAQPEEPAGPGGEEPGVDPGVPDVPDVPVEPTPDPGEDPVPVPSPGDVSAWWNKINITHPAEGGKLGNPFFKAKVELYNDKNASAGRGVFSTPSIELKKDGTYTFSVALFKKGNILLDKGSVRFSAEGVANERTGDWRIAVKPNPNHGDFEIEAPCGSRVEIFNAAGGAAVQSFTCASGRCRVHLASAGMYLLHITHNGQLRTVKVLVN